MLEDLSPFRPGAGLQPPALAGRDEQLEVFDALLLRTKRGRIDRGDDHAGAAWRGQVCVAESPPYAG